LQLTGNKTAVDSYSTPINFFGVTTLNVNGEAQGTNNAHNDINALYITPYADNTPQGWGVQTFFDQGDKNNDGDLVTFDAIAGISENTVIAPSAPLAGQVYATNAATGTSIAVVNYTLNTDIIINGTNSAAGETDTLTLKGADPGPGTTGNNQFTANFS